jgi:hypothetical protein
MTISTRGIFCEPKTVGEAPTVNFIKRDKMYKKEETNVQKKGLAQSISQTNSRASSQGKRGDFRSSFIL